MALCGKYGFDPECTVVIKGVSKDVNLSTLKRAFILLDDVAKIQRIDGISDTVLCQFVENVTPVLVEGSFSNDDGSQWEIVQVENYCAENENVQEHIDNVVPLARIIDDMTITFQEQLSQLAITYNINPATLSQSAANYICGKMDISQKHLTSTPAPRPKPQPPSGSLSEPTNATGHEQPLTGDASLTIPVPADVQRVVVEHIVKHNTHPYTSTTKEPRLFSGNFPKPPSEVDYSVWRLRAKQVLNDISLSEGQQRHALLDSLLSPALNVALGIGPQESPQAYLRELENAYGNVTGKEELYIQFLETHQNNGEKASDYLRRLQILLQEILERGGVAKQDAESQLLRQFLRGCWNDDLITALHLKELLSNLGGSIPTFSQLLLKIRTHEKEWQLKEVRKKRYMGVASTKVHTKTLTMREFDTSEVSEAATREQLEKRIRQLEDELRISTSAEDAKQSRHVKDGQRSSNKPKSTNVTSLLPTLQRTKFRKFCYQCGEDSHMLPQCSNAPNAVLVQRKLCERHNSRRDQQQVSPQTNQPLNM